MSERSTSVPRRGAHCAAGSRANEPSWRWSLLQRSCRPPTETVWIYDTRTNVPGITKKDRPLTREHFAEFEKCYGADPNGRSKRREKDSKEDRWRKFEIGEVRKRKMMRRLAFSGRASA